MAAITEHCHSLRTLDISVCKGVTMTAVEQLQSHLPLLDSVNHCFVGGANPTFVL